MLHRLISCFIEDELAGANYFYNGEVKWKNWQVRQTDNALKNNTAWFSVADENIQVKKKFSSTSDLDKLRL